MVGVSLKQFVTVTAIVKVMVVAMRRRFGAVVEFVNGEGCILVAIVVVIGEEGFIYLIVSIFCGLGGVQ